MDTVPGELFHKFQACGHYFANCRGGWGFTVHPEQGLGAGLPEEDPAVIVQKDFRTIELANLPDAAAGEVARRIVLPSGDHGVSRLNGYVEIPAVIMELPEFPPHVADQFCTGFPRGGKEVEKQQVNEYPVPFRKVARKANAAALLPAD